MWKKLTDRMYSVALLPYGKGCSLRFVLREMWVQLYHYRIKVKEGLSVKFFLHFNKKNLFSSRNRHFYTSDYSHCFSIFSNFLTNN